MLKRFVLAGLIITLLSAATVSSAVLLEVDQAVQIFKHSRSRWTRRASSCSPASRPATRRRSSSSATSAAARRRS